jgi:hypothetical protein
MRTPGENKRAPRVDLRRPATLVNSDGADIPVVILDVSSGGFRLEVSEHLRIGERVTLQVERGETIPAQIRWALGSEAGGVFLTTVDYAGLQHLAGATAMAEQGSDLDRRQDGERREDERRQGGERRHGSRKEDRRQDDRRKGERRD